MFVPFFLNAQATAIDELFDKYSGKEGFTSVYISPGMFELISHVDCDDETVEIMSSLKCIKILASEDDCRDTENINFYQEIIDKIPLDEYKELMVVREKDQDLKFLVKEDQGIITELLLIAGGEDNALISIQGNINLKKISSLSKSMNVCGIRHLKLLEDDIF